MELGIDLGTTRTVVAVHDRGNFPVVSFADPSGDMHEHVPTSTAVCESKLVHGHAAEAAAQRGAPILRSWKRLLGELGPDGLIPIGHVKIRALELATSFLRSLLEDLRLRSSLQDQLARTNDDEPLRAAVSVPANAHSTQRFITLEAFRNAGFDVLSVINEPSAAGIEYAHRYRNTVTSKREYVVIYDLGGGTFDTALVSMGDGRHDVVRTAGISRLGGDDFDQELLALALETGGLSDRDLAHDERQELLAECRTIKEAIHPNTRKVSLELPAIPDAERGPVVVVVSDYYERLRPLVVRSVDALSPVLGDEGGEIAGIYMVGGASGLPIVPRIVKERFGRRVHRSPHPSAATAVGLAIAAAANRAPSLNELFTRHFGVFREGEDGQRVLFDRIFEKGTPMPTTDEKLTRVRRYRPVHNIGHYRFVESGDVDDAGDPTGDISPHGELRVAFDTPDVALDRLQDREIRRLAAHGPEIEERYEVDAAGILRVSIKNVESGRAAEFVL